MTQHQDKKDGDCALYVPCSQVQLARVVVRVLVLVDVIYVIIVVLIVHVDVVHAVDTVFVAIFCSWRCTLYMEGLRNGLSQNGFLDTSSHLQKNAEFGDVLCRHQRLMWSNAGMFSFWKKEIPRRILDQRVFARYAVILVTTTAAKWTHS